MAFALMVLITLDQRGREIATIKYIQWFDWYYLKRDAIRMNQKYIKDHQDALQAIVDIEIGKLNARKNWTRHKNVFIKEMV